MFLVIFCTYAGFNIKTADYDGVIKALATMRAAHGQRR